MTVPIIADARPVFADDLREQQLRDIGSQLLTVLGADPLSPDLARTPERWARWWMEFISYEPGTTDTVFEAAHTDQMVVVSGIRVWSLCEHHLLPFWCDIAIGYIADGRILGLSKFARIAHLYAHRLQVQERLVTNIAEHVSGVTGTENVAVLASGEHLCMTMRGIRSPARMVSSAMLGCFRRDRAARAEFFALAGQPTP